MKTLNLASSFAASIVRLGTGMKSQTMEAPTKKPLVLYEFEGCPYCRKVREALTELNLDADIKPCPKNGLRYREEVRALGGKLQFPYLIDPDTGWAGYESAEIIHYLYRTYGQGKKPGFLLRNNLVANLNSTLSSAVRPTKGTRAQPSRPPAQPLELYSFEISPYCRIVRERLCELELPYRLHNVGKGSPSRHAFVQRSGKMMVPYLIDPNTDTELFESADIIDYLNTHYAA